MIKDLFMIAAGFAIACAFIYAPTAHADTVMHVMVYNVQTTEPTEHAVFAMPSRAVCESALSDWDGLSNDAGDRSEARCIEVINVGVTE